jgi:predicted nucleotidyltransferase
MPSSSKVHRIEIPTELYDNIATTAKAMHLRPQHLARLLLRVSIDLYDDRPTEYVHEAYPLLRIAAIMEERAQASGTKRKEQLKASEERLEALLRQLKGMRAQPTKPATHNTTED